MYLNKKVTFYSQVCAVLMLLSATMNSVYAGDMTKQAATEKSSAQASTAKKKIPWTKEDVSSVRAVYQKLTETRPSPGLPVGTKAPNFKIKNVMGKTIELDQVLKQGPVVLVFYRGSWCPYCNLHLHALKNSKDEFAKYNAQVIAISPQTPDKSAEQIKKDGFAFEVLSDDSSTVSKAYDLYFDLGDDFMRVYKKHGLNLEEFNGKGQQGLPIPAAFIIDQQGVIRAMQAEIDFKTRMSPEAIIKALSQLYP